MPFRHFPLPDLIEAWLHVKTPHLRQRRCRSTSFMPQTPITWPFGTLLGSPSSRTPIKTLRRKLSGHLARIKNKNGIFHGGSGEGQDEAGGMSESARIAFAYRASQNPVEVSASDLPSSRGNHLVLGKDNSQKFGSDVKSVSMETSEIHHRSFGLSNMLSQLCPIIIEKEVPDRERCRLALHHHRSICTNVIVESQCPDRTPHIVITPPPEEDVVEAPLVAQDNQIPFQYYLSLRVPPLCILTCRMMTFEQWDYFHLPSFGGSVNQIIRPVFSRPKFAQWVKRTAEHRNCLFRRLIIPAVTRYLVKVSALAASNLAPSFRARYDMPEFLPSVENPFRWTDPAMGLLSLYRRHPIGVHHIPSPEPFSVPHILIEESFGNDQTIVDGNAAPFQNSEDRNSLLVPTSINSSLMLDDMEELSLDYDSSTCQSSPLETPIELGKVDYGLFSSWYTKTPLRDDLLESYPTLSAPYRDSKALFFIEEEEEEEEFI